MSDIYIFQLKNTLQEEQERKGNNLRKEEIIYKRWAVHIYVRMNRPSQMVPVIQHNSLLS